MGNDVGMRRFWLRVASAVVLVSGCSAGSKAPVPDVTIPVETSIATTVPVERSSIAEPSSTLTTSTNTTAPSAAEEELRAATRAYWDEFRRTLLNIQSDDLGALTKWYASPEIAREALAALSASKSEGVSYREKENPFFRVKVESVQLADPYSTVVSCVAENLDELSLTDGGQVSVDGSTEAFRFTFQWIRAGERWVVGLVSERTAVDKGDLCD